MQLEGKTVLITGAGRGLGAAMVLFAMIGAVALVQFRVLRSDVEY